MKTKPLHLEIQNCPICGKPLKADDLCASDITEGTCHAGCLEGSAVVNLDTGDELPDSKIATYPHSDVMEPGSLIPHLRKWTRWQGGKMPVPQGASVEVILRYGKQAPAEAGSGYAARWSYDSRHGDHDDIVFYRLCTPTPVSNVSLSEDQVSAVLHLVESRLAIVWAKVGAREAFANELRVLEPVSDDEPEVCEACSGIIEEGDLVYWALDGGHLHAGCCGPERKSYCGPDGEPLKDDEPIPEPFAWRSDQ